MRRNWGLAVFKLVVSGGFIQSFYLAVKSTIDSSVQKTVFSNKFYIVFPKLSELIISAFMSVCKLLIHSIHKTYKLLQLVLLNNLLLVAGE